MLIILWIHLSKYLLRINFTIFLNLMLVAVVVQTPSQVQLFAVLWTAAHQACLSFTISQSLLKVRSIELVILRISSSATLFSFCFQSFSESGSFLVSWLFASGDQSIRTSASILSMNIQCYC